MDRVLLDAAVGEATGKDKYAVQYATKGLQLDTEFLKDTRHTTDLKK